MSSTPLLTSHSRFDATPEYELDAIVRIYARAMQRYEEKKGGTATAARDDAERRSDEIRTTNRISR
jgi:hypothetical protein